MQLKESLHLSRASSFYAPFVLFCFVFLFYLGGGGYVLLIGIAQAAEFNRKWKEAAAAAAAGESAASTVAVQEVAKEENAENSDEKRSAQTKAERCAAFLSAGIIFASPLTRAVETALVGCEGHPYFQTPGAALHLMRSAREARHSHIFACLLFFLINCANTSQLVYS